ncbi:hypothetical protein ACQ4PT_001091 [Festuca glaucescens]
MEDNILERILDGSMEPTDLPLETLRKITDNFSESRIIGEGGFGTVYKGVLPNGDVAVKKIMSSMTIDEKLFRREVDSLMEVKHQNIIKFLGFCSHTVHKPVKNPESRGYIYAEKRERLLCFEYISNGSLAKYITDELRGLEWDTRYRVIKGICTGLYYLHMKKCILHMDLKPANILLDNQMVPKITDFGLSRPSEKSQTTSTNNFATPGYSAPENWSGGGRMTVKSDIYSLGTIIVELVTGHKGIPDDKSKILRRWRHRWNKSAREITLAYQQITKCIEIGILCQATDPCKRPLISDIMNAIDEIGSINNDIWNGNDATIGQINLSSWEDDMLGIEPLDLRFSNYKHNNEHISSSCSVELSNNTYGFIAFNIQTASLLPYRIEPNMDIVPPQSKISVDITRYVHRDKVVLQYTGQFIVRSMEVNEGLATKDIKQDMFDKGKDVDEVHLTVVSEAQLQVTSRAEEPSKEVIPLQAECSEMMLLNVHPLELRFPFIPKSTIPCSLHLTNKTDEPVVFRLMEKNVRCSAYMIRVPVHGIVPPNSTYTLVLTTYEMNELPRETNMDLILQNSVANSYIQPFIDDDECEQFFEEVRETGDTFSEVALQAVCAPLGETIYEIIPLVRTTCIIYSFDGHPTEPWIIMGLIDGRVHLWNYETQRIMCSLKVSRLSVKSTKIVVRKQWFLAGDTDGYIHVCNYGTELKKITAFRACSHYITSLAVHPTKPYVLSSTLRDIYLWDWDNDWNCVQTFSEHSGTVEHITFNPRDHNNFASSSADRTVKVWNLDSPESSYTLSGHSDTVTCLDFFTRDDQLYLISCSDDLTVKIWDMKEKTCIRTIEAFTSPVTCVISHSDRPYLVTGSKDGLVHLWSSSSFRLERIFAVPRGGVVCGLIWLRESQGFVIGQDRLVTIMDIDNEE